MTITAYKHIALTDDGIPVIEGTRFKVKQLVAEGQAHGSSPEELQFQHPQLTTGTKVEYKSLRIF